MEKSEQNLPFASPAVSQPTSRRNAKHVAILPIAALLFCTFAAWRSDFQLPSCMGHHKASEQLCPQVQEFVPKKNAKLWDSLSQQFTTNDFEGRAIDWLAGAVRIPTESYDLMAPVGVDPRWEAFAPFHEYLLQAFPLIHSTLKVTKVNTWGLVYHWQGSDADLKPILLAAHQDVVPVHPNTVDKWKFPPYSGHFDGKNIWGRGSLDDKSGLIGILAAIESLLEKSFQPTRSVVMAFGFDEEASGVYGAQELAKHLEKVYGASAFAFIVDEGSGFGEQYGKVFAVPGIAEKGYVDVRIDVASPGGHSSIPPPHTSIGILAALLVEFESNPFEVHLARDTPIYSSLECLAAHATSLPSHVKKNFKKSATSNKALRKVEEFFFQIPAFKSLTGTTQAIDMIDGGVKANALPEQAGAVVNHRIATESSLTALKERDIALLKPLASRFNLTFTAFGVPQSDPDAPAYGTLNLGTPFMEGLEPAPITPVDAHPYALLSGTIKATYNKHRGRALRGEDEIIIAPGIMSGNTEHIFRYGHRNQGNGSALAGGIHTTNEGESKSTSAT
ncbi:hypothetical protein HWV62_4719 [Athelia sp. TMB]|nr:hypothetical protein HWV62_4719 [Athelia sp. TMB]